VSTAPPAVGDFCWAKASSSGIGGEDRALAGGSGGIGLPFLPPLRTSERQGSQGRGRSMA